MKNFLLKAVDLAALNALDPVVRLTFGEDPPTQLRKIARFVVVPIAAFAAFLGIWWAVAENVVTKSGKMPTPPVVLAAAGDMWKTHLASIEQRQRFYQGRESRVAALESSLTDLDSPARRERLERLRKDLAEAEASASPRAEAKRFALEAAESQAAAVESQIEAARHARYAGAPTYLDQIATSLKTVFFGFAIATLIAVPIGVLCGVSPTFMAAVSPLVALFKPVSPIVWLPICGIVVGAYVDAETSLLAPAFVSSAITVALCSLWPTLVNTALGVASIDKDHLNVARVLRLSSWTRLTKIIIPSALPLIFTGLRISLGVGWMVLIAAELLATNPGLGKFVWDAFQNGGSQSFAQMFVAVFTVGVIGLLLDRLMVILQRAVSVGREASPSSL
ncbi:MAG TPA: ABC transporter permease [Pirellulaceae bacterium]|jgi:nitrate/nitrite transport system permease protein|nr:ABC transporter permease [Pirellulaceae bacterium]